MVIDKCFFCDKSVDRYNPGTWKQVKGWVGGPRKDSMKFRSDTGVYAHPNCIKKLNEGQVCDQPSLLDEEQRVDSVTDDDAKAAEDIKELFS